MLGSGERQISHSAIDDLLLEPTLRKLQSSRSNYRAMSKRKYTQPLTLANLKMLYDSHKLWLNPDYQRGEVWTKSQKQLLVDSILSNIDIPRIYLREIKKGSFEFEVVDGQQRLRAIFEYLAGVFALDVDSDTIEGEAVANKAFGEVSTKIQI